MFIASAKDQACSQTGGTRWINGQSTLLHDIIWEWQSFTILAHAVN